MNLEKYKLKNCQSILLVFLDGIFRPEFSDVCSQIAVNYSNDINIKIQENISLDSVIHLLYLSSKEKKSASFNLDISIEIGKNSSIILFEDSAFVESGNLNTKLFLQSNAKANFSKIYQNSFNNINANFQANLKHNSALSYQNAIFGGENISEKINIFFHESNAFCEANGLYKLHETQNLNLNIKMEHLAANCNSKQNFKGIINDAARAIFTGRIIVPQNAVKTEGILLNKNLLLSDKAQVQSLPLLEIYTDDVKCSHGSSIGQLDKEALLYLRSRGFNADFAKQILVDAFSAEIIDKFPEFLSKNLRIIN